MTRNRVFFLCCVFSISLFACDDDDGAVPSANHGVPGSKALNTLSQDEVDRICEDNRRRADALTASYPEMRDLWQTGCTVVGLIYAFNGGTKAECESARDRCLQAVNSRIGDAGSTNQVQNVIELPCPPAATLTGCSVDVSDFDACTNERLAAFQNAIQETTSAMKSISCNNAGQAVDTGVFTSTGEIDLRIQPPEACNSLLQQCPGAALF